MDGLLIDSEPLWRVAEKEEFAKVGIELVDTMCDATMGQRTDEVVRFWYSRAPWAGPSPDEVARAITGRVHELITSRGQALPGAARAVQLLRDHGMGLAVASSSPPALIDAALATIGLGASFDVVVSAVDESFGKPHPGVFLRAAERLAAAPHHCVVFEDSVAGVRGARRAGMTVVAVPAAQQADDPDFALAHGRLRDLTELSLEWLESLRELAGLGP